MLGQFNLELFYACDVMHDQPILTPAQNKSSGVDQGTYGRGIPQVGSFYIQWTIVVGLYFKQDQFHASEGNMAHRKRLTAQEGLKTNQQCRNAQQRAPLFLENIETDVAVQVYIGMETRRLKAKRWGRVGIG